VKPVAQIIAETVAGFRATAARLGAHAAPPSRTTPS
jgi:hypothetical protein